jgi:hypothetical protein
MLARINMIDKRRFTFNMNEIDQKDVCKVAHVRIVYVSEHIKDLPSRATIQIFHPNVKFLRSRLK